MRSPLRNPSAHLLINLAAGVIPGAIGAYHLTALLFFLNPELPFTTASFLRGLARYGALLGAVSFALHLALSRASPHRMRRLLPWSIGLTLLLGGVGERAHADYFSSYLPAGIRTRLAVFGLWTLLAALVVLATAAFHLGRRAYGPRSRGGLLIVVALSSFAALDRRAAFRRPPPEEPRPSSVQVSGSPRLLVVGLESASLDAILPLAQQGHLPFFATLLREGAVARLESFSPVRRVPHWVSLATGKQPSRHGVLGPRSYEADFLAADSRLDLLPQGLRFDSWGLLGSAPRNVGRGSWRAAPLWDVLPNIGVESATIGWPGTHPAALTTARGVSLVISDRFFVTGGEVPDGTKPAEFAARARRFRESRAEQADRGVLPAGSPGSVERALALDRWRCAVVLRSLEERPDIRATFVYLPGLLAANRTSFGGFAAFAEGSTSADARRARDVLLSYLGELDGFLADAWRRMPQPAILVVTSPYGIAAPSGWRAALARLNRAEALRGRVQPEPDGMLMLSGSGVRPTETVARFDVLDLVPTLAYRMGLGIARDLEGRVRTEVFSPEVLANQPLTFVPSYDSLGVARSLEVSSPPSAPP